MEDSFQRRARPLKSWLKTPESGLLQLHADLQPVVEHGLRELNRDQEVAGNVIPALLKPRHEPVDKAAVHERWDQAHVAAEGPTEGRELQDLMQVAPSLLRE